MDYRLLDHRFTSVTPTRVVATLLIWAGLTTIAAWTIGPRTEHVPRPLEVFAVTPAEAESPVNKPEDVDKLNKVILLNELAKVPPTTTTVARRVTVGRWTPSGTCAEWVAAAGITDTANAYTLIARESGCDPYARNRYSGACGVAQALPCSKQPCAMGDGYCQVAWMRDYVAAKYGSFANAVAFWDRNGWY